MDNSLSSSLMFLVLAGIYAYVAYSIQLISRKTNIPKGWLAWIPIANIFLLLKIARKPNWWFILLLIPLVDIVIIAKVWMAVSLAVNKQSWLGILMLIPGVNFFIIGYLAFSQSSQEKNQITPDTDAKDFEGV